jgi:transcriptional repressor NrdR
MQCGRRFTTYEKIELVPLLVVKKDKRREPFDSQKIRNGILHACEKRPVSLTEIDGIVTRIEQSVYNAMEAEVTTRQIGEMVMAELKKLDDVSYVRFASVYRQFTDVSSFMEELTKLLGENQHHKEDNN